MNDPIRELLSDLERDGRPALAWVVRWSEAGDEPVAAAWARAWSPLDMVRLLVRIEHPSRAEAERVLHAPMLWSETDVDPVRCDAIRRLVSTPPTLAELLRPRSGWLPFLPASSRCETVPVR